eukprot:maker-scaffold12_size759060-snap-gene-4.12 protein:Tk05570 transcript:maker-scaffold12_size759060-snap-gene-4.12-mRNA-1 annotation:"flexible cuticle protein 12 precursor"
MNRFMGFLAFLALASGAPQGGLYNGDPSLAKILQEQRFNVGNNQFGHATHQEDGVIIKEESTGQNNRIGQYQYVGDDGKTYTVKYEAGVNGFRILEGDHIPSGGQTAAQAVEDVEYDYQYYDDALPDSPFVNPYDPSHQKPELLAGNLAGHLASLYREPVTQKPKVDPLTLEVPTHPQRFFPAGEVQFDRFVDGFNYNFKSNKK